MREEPPTEAELSAIEAAYRSNYEDPRAHEVVRLVTEVRRLRAEAEVRGALDRYGVKIGDLGAQFKEAAWIESLREDCGGMPHDFSGAVIKAELRDETPADLQCGRCGIMASAVFRRAHPTP